MDLLREKLTCCKYVEDQKQLNFKVKLIYTCAHTFLYLYLYHQFTYMLFDWIIFVQLLCVVLVTWSYILFFLFTNTHIDNLPLSLSSSLHPFLPTFKILVKVMSISFITTTHQHFASK